MHEDISKHTVGQTTPTPNYPQAVPSCISCLLSLISYPRQVSLHRSGLLRVCVLHYRICRVPTTNLTGQEPTNFNLLVV